MAQLYCIKSKYLKENKMQLKKKNKYLVDVIDTLLLISMNFFNQLIDSEYFEGICKFD